MALEQYISGESELSDELNIYMKNMTIGTKEHGGRSMSICAKGRRKIQKLCSIKKTEEQKKDMR